MPVTMNFRATRILILVLALPAACLDARQGQHAATTLGDAPDAHAATDGSVASSDVVDPSDALVETSPPTRPDASDMDAPDLCLNVACPDPGPCCSSVCNPATGVCEDSCVSAEPVESSCHGDDDCDDGDPCTSDHCQVVDPPTCQGTLVLACGHERICDAPNPAWNPMCRPSQAAVASPMAIEDNRSVQAFYGPARPVDGDWSCQELGEHEFCSKSLILGTSSNHLTIAENDAEIAPTCDYSDYEPLVRCYPLYRDVAYVAWGAPVVGEGIAGSVESYLDLDDFCLLTTEALAGNYTAHVSLDSGPSFLLNVDVTWQPSTGLLVVEPRAGTCSGDCGLMPLTTPSALVPGDGFVDFEADHGGGAMPVTGRLFSVRHALVGNIAGPGLESVKLVLERRPPE